MGVVESELNLIHSYNSRPSKKVLLMSQGKSSPVLTASRWETLAHSASPPPLLNIIILGKSIHRVSPPEILKSVKDSKP